MKKVVIKGFKDGKEIDIEVSALTLGAADLVRFDGMDIVTEVLDKYVELGGNILDTGRHYRDSEKILNDWMTKRENRKDLVIFTKGCHPTREFPDTPRVNAKAIKEDLEMSLEVLGTDHVELYALHRDDESVPVKEIMDELNKQIEEGKVYAIGVSNWSLERIKEANEYALANNLRQFTFNSPNLSLAKPVIPRWPGCVSANDEMVKWHEDNNMVLISWSSQAGGFFTGRFTKEDRSNQEMVDCFYTDDNWERYDRAIKLAKEKNITPIQIALAYVVNQKFPCCAVIGARNLEELVSSYEGSTIVLTTEEMDYLNLK